MLFLVKAEQKEAAREQLRSDSEILEIIERIVADEHVRFGAQILGNGGQQWVFVVEIDDVAETFREWRAGHSSLARVTSVEPLLSLEDFKAVLTAPAG